LLKQYLTNNIVYRWIAVLAWGRILFYEILLLKQQLPYLQFKVCENEVFSYQISSRSKSHTGVHVSVSDCNQVAVYINVRW